MTADNDAVIQAVEVNGGRIMAGPVYWEGAAGPMLVLWCETDVPKAFRLNGHRLQPAPYAKGIVVSRGSPGGALTLSSNGTKPSTGVLWATVADGRSADHGNAPGVLHAFNAENLEEIWNSEQHTDRDRLGTLVKFVPPLVAVGKVYAPNYDNAVNVYGLLPVSAAF
jgi:outer membrane protein assembly factor BamB